MRTTYVFALVASLLIFTGCSAIDGPGCGQSCGGGGQWGGFCNDSSCGGSDQGGGSFFGGGFARPSFGFNRMGGGGYTSTGYESGGCATGNCDGGDYGQTEANFSDCGPMCGAYLNDVPASGGCDCGDCQMGQSYVQGQWKNMMNRGISWPTMSWPRPFASQFAGGYSSGCDDGGCDSGGYVEGGYGGEGCVGAAGPCRGLGRFVGCLGCNECGGGNAIGTNHSDYSESMPVGAGFAGGRSGALAGGARRILSVPFRPGGSPHPYGGEIPHTASAQGGAGGGGAAPSYSYPYYTTRGPRDFLMSNPPSIGR